MNVENFYLFSQVVEKGSFSEVARINYLSQPAVTRKMNQMEEKYGTLLFDRTAGNIRLTGAGEILYSYAKVIVEYDKQSLDAVRLFLGKQDKLIRIGASLTIGEYLLPSMLGGFNKKYKETKFSVIIGNTPFILSSLANYKIDIALVESEVSVEGFQMEEFSKDELILVISSEHHWSDKKVITLDELIGEKIIWREKDSGMRLMIEQAFIAKDVLNSMKNTMELGSIQSIKSAVEANLGVSLLPRITVKKELSYGTLREVNIKDFTLKRNLWMVEKPQRFVRDRIVKLKGFIRKKGQDY